MATYLHLCNNHLDKYIRSLNADQHHLCDQHICHQIGYIGCIGYIGYIGYICHQIGGRGAGRAGWGGRLDEVAGQLLPVII